MLILCKRQMHPRKGNGDPVKRLSHVLTRSTLPTSPSGCSNRASKGLSTDVIGRLATDGIQYYEYNDILENERIFH
jgi:hypothetical protein